MLIRKQAKKKRVGKSRKSDAAPSSRKSSIAPAPTVKHRSSLAPSSSAGRASLGVPTPKRSSMAPSTTPGRAMPWETKAPASAVDRKAQIEAKRNNSISSNKAAVKASISASRQAPAVNASKSRLDKVKFSSLSCSPFQLNHPSLLPSDLEQ